MPLKPASIKHFLNTQDWSRAELDALLTQAAIFKRSKVGDSHGLECNLFLGTVRGKYGTAGVSFTF